MAVRVIKTRRGKLDLGQAFFIWTRFRRYARSQIGLVLGALGGVLGIILMQVLAPWPIKVIFDFILSDNMPTSWIARSLSQIAPTPSGALAWVCAAVMIIATCDAVFAYVRDILMARAGQRVVGKIRGDLFAHLQTLSPADVAVHHTGALLTRLTGDIQMLRQMLINSTINLAENSLLILILIAAMFYLNPTLALIGICTLPLSLWAGLRISPQIRKAATKQRERESEIATHAVDVLGAMTTVQAYNRESIEQQRFKRQNRASIRAGLRATKLASKLQRIVSLASAASLCLILYVGVSSVLAATITAGDLLVFVSYLRAVNKPMRKMAKLAGQYAKATACGMRIAEVFDIEPTIRDRFGVIDLDRVRGDIEFQKVGFSYGGHGQAVSDISFSIAPSQRVALVGHTGAGKTTLVKLLLRFYDPENGGVLLDGNDLRDVSLGSLRRNIGWVHQDTVLFGMSVGENIALGRPDAEPEEIRRIAERVRADEFIEALPEGYDTVLGQEGGTLSGGERQRIALARALLREPAILLLDEPATGLDGPTRRTVEEAWLSGTNAATTIVICHRLVDMERFHKIIVMAHGKIVGTGTHDELVGTNSDYTALFAAGDDSKAFPFPSQVIA